MRYSNYFFIIIAFSIPGLLILPLKTRGQEISRDKAGCTIIARGQPALFIDYERMDKDGKNVWLHLYNNTSCGIIIEADRVSGNSETLFKRKDAKNSEGTGRRYVLDSPTEGDLLVVAYNYRDRQNKKAPEPANYSASRDYVVILIIPPGRSVRFSVDTDYLKKGFDISVPFTYEWDEDALVGVGPADHQLFFYSSQLPEGTIQKLAETGRDRK